MTLAGFLLGLQGVPWAIPKSPSVQIVKAVRQ